MYTFILALHNIMRWVALILVAVATIRALIGLFGNREWSETDRRIGSFSAISVDIQLLLGLILYFVVSPITKVALQDFGAAMGVTDLRFFALEHPFYMVLALIFVHLGSVLPRRVENSKGKYMRAAIFFGLTLLLLIFGIPWSRPLLPAF